MKCSIQILLLLYLLCSCSRSKLKLPVLETESKNNQISYIDLEEITPNLAYAGVATINKSQIDKTWRNDTKFIKKKYLSKLKKHQFFIFAKKNSQIIAYTIIKKEEKNPTASHISFIAVHQDFKGQKIGKNLLLFAANKIKKLGNNSITLNCAPHVLEFYKKCFSDRRKFSFNSKDSGRKAFGDIRLNVTIHFFSSKKTKDFFKFN